jgi:hypothetical protein
MNDPEVIAAIETLKNKGVTFEQIEDIYKHYYANLPTPGNRIQWGYGIETVLENTSNMYRVEDGYIRIKNRAGTDLYLLPHEYRVMTKETGGESA